MRNALPLYRRNLQILLAVHGSYSEIAKAIGVDRAYLYRNKNAPSRKLQSRVACEAGLIRLREFIKLARAEFHISDADAQRLMLSINAQLVERLPP